MTVFVCSMGSLTLHQSINFEHPSQNNLLSTIFSGDQGDVWKLFQTMIEPGDLGESDIFEVSSVMRIKFAEFMTQIFWIWYDSQLMK